MKIDRFRRALVRLFGRGATSVSPEIRPSGPAGGQGGPGSYGSPARDPDGYMLTVTPGVFGLMTARVEYVGRPWSPPAPTLPTCATPAPFLAHHITRPDAMPLNVWYQDFTPIERPESLS